MKAIQKLNQQRPELRITAEISEITALCVEGERMINRSIPPTRDQQSAYADEIEQLVSKIIASVDFMAAWKSSIPDVWHGTEHRAADVWEGMHDADSPSEYYDPKEVLHCFVDPWFAYIWNFSAAAHIFLQSVLIRLLSRSDQLVEHSPDQHNDERRQLAQESIIQLAGKILQSVPNLLDHKDLSARGIPTRSHGRLAGRFLALFSVEVVQKTAYAEANQRELAGKIVGWIRSVHALA
jgi:hypothetical protein